AVRLASPSAKKPADRSSNTGTASTPGCRANAMVSGVQRDPGDTTARTTPHRTSVSTSTLHHNELVFRKSKGVITAPPCTPPHPYQPGSPWHGHPAHDLTRPPPPPPPSPAK